MDKVSFSHCSFRPVHHSTYLYIREHNKRERDHDCETLGTQVSVNSQIMAQYLCRTTTSWLRYAVREKLVWALKLLSQQAMLLCCLANAIQVPHPRET